MTAVEMVLVVLLIVDGVLTFLHTLHAKYSNELMTAQNDLIVSQYKTILFLLGEDDRL